MRYQPPTDWQLWVTWLAAGIQDDVVGYYYFLQPLGRKAKEMGIHLPALVTVSGFPQGIGYGRASK